LQQKREQIHAAARAPCGHRSSPARALTIGSRQARASGIALKRNGHRDKREIEVELESEKGLGV